MKLFGKSQEQVAAAQREEILQYKRAFGTEDGKFVFMDLCNRFHVLNTHKGDAFAEGQRSVVLLILEKCNMNMELFDQLLKGDLE